VLEGCVNGSGKETVLEGTEEENGEECGGDARKGDKKIHAQKKPLREAVAREKLVNHCYFTF
jgi:predicted ATPase